MIRIGVIGQAGELPTEVQRISEEVGAEIAKRKAVLLTGGGSGVMEFVSKGAKETGGLVIGILPGDSIDAEDDYANDYIDIPITTGLNFDYRSLILVHSSDAIVMIGGGNGTLGELSAAYLNQKPVIIIEPSGGWAEKVRGLALEEKYLDNRKSVEISYAQTAKEALDLAFDLIEKKKSR